MYLSTLKSPSLLRVKMFVTFQTKRILVHGRLISSGAILVLFHWKIGFWEIDGKLSLMFIIDV